MYVERESAGNCDVIKSWNRAFSQEFYHPFALQYLAHGNATTTDIFYQCYPSLYTLSVTGFPFDSNSFSLVGTYILSWEPGIYTYIHTYFLRIEIYRKPWLSPVNTGLSGASTASWQFSGVSRAPCPEVVIFFGLFRYTSTLYIYIYIYCILY